MISRALLFTLFVCLFLSLLSVDVFAGRKRLKKPSEKTPGKPALISKSRNMVVGNLAIGRLTGDVTEVLPSPSYQMLYGFGVNYEHYLKPRIGLGFALKWTWVTAFQFSEVKAFTLYRFSPATPRTVYLKAGVGQVSAGEWYLSFNCTQLSATLGLLTWGSGRTHSRIEFSYNRVLYDRDHVRGFASGMHNDDVNYFRLDVGLGLPF